MVLNRLILFSPLLTFLLLVLGGALFADLGAVIVRRRMQRLGEDSEMSDLVVAPVLGLFALVVALCVPVLVLGAILGVPLGLVPMTAVPQRTALSHAFGALAAGLLYMVVMR